MKVQIVAKIQKFFDKKDGKWKFNEQKISNVEEIEFDPLNSQFAITNDKKLRYFFLNKDCYRLSLDSFKKCKKKNLVGV